MINQYPYSDAHELNLDWIILKVKELIAAWAETSAAWETQQQAFDELKAFVNDYFDNLDVQQEINNKIDDLVLNGTLSELIAPYVASGLPSVVADQIAAVVAAQIYAVVAAQLPAVAAEQLPAIVATETAGQAAAWLETHVNPDTGYVIDNSLTIAGAAADAKAAGDAIGELKSALSEIVYGGYISNQFVQGKRLQNAPNVIVSDTARVTSELFYLFKGDIISINGTFNGLTYGMLGAKYSSGWKTSKFSYEAQEEGYYWLNVAKTNLTDAIAPSDVDFVVSSTQRIRREINEIWEEKNLIVSKLTFVRGYFHVRDGQSNTNDTWSRSVINILDGIPSDVAFIKAKISTAKAFIEIFTEKPNYANSASNALKFVGAYESSDIGEEIVVPINPSYYYVLQSNVPTSEIENLEVTLVLNRGSDLYGFTKDRTKFNKTFSVMGDSISTYTGISPSGTGYASLYPTADVTNVSGMWWYKLAEMTGMRINRINANSGSAVCADANPGRVECSSDERCSDLGTNPDYIICYCGINDYYLNVDMGTYDGTQSLVSATRTTFKEAYASMLYKMHTNYPHAKIYCGLIQQNVHSGYDTLSDNLQTVVNGYGKRLVDFNNTIKEIAEMFGCGIINMDKCGFNLDNLEDYTIDSSPNCFHPNDAGHTLMALQAFKDMGLIE